MLISSWEREREREEKKKDFSSSENSTSLDVASSNWMLNFFFDSLLRLMRGLFVSF